MTAVANVVEASTNVMLDAMTGFCQSRIFKKYVRVINESIEQKIWFAELKI